MFIFSVVLLSFECAGSGGIDKYYSKRHLKSEKIRSNFPLLFVTAFCLPLSCQLFLPDCSYSLVVCCVKRCLKPEVINHFVATIDWSFTFINCTVLLFKNEQGTLCIGFTLSGCYEVLHVHVYVYFLNDLYTQAYSVYCVQSLGKWGTCNVRLWQLSWFEWLFVSWHECIRQVQCT